MDPTYEFFYSIHSVDKYLLTTFYVRYCSRYSEYVSEPETNMLDFTELLVGEIRYILVMEIIRFFYALFIKSQF